MYRSEMLPLPRVQQIVETNVATRVEYYPREQGVYHDSKQIPYGYHPHHMLSDRAY